jgi:hypothetical protein
VTPGEAKALYMGLTSDQQLRVLALLAHNVTITARAAGAGQAGGAAEKMRAFNEVLHTITGQLMHLIARDANSYADDEFVDALFERAQQGNCAGDLSQAFAWSQSATPAPACR